jgi:hypothetical protein
MYHSWARGESIKYIYDYLKERAYLEYLLIYGNVILKWTLQKYIERKDTRLICSGWVSVAGSGKCLDEPSSSKKFC